MVCKQVVPSGSFSLLCFHLNQHEKDAYVYAFFSLHESHKLSAWMKIGVETYPARGQGIYISHSAFLSSRIQANEAVWCSYLSRSSATSLAKV